jgi:hypothetical protein
VREAHPNDTMHLMGSYVAWQDDSALIGMDDILPIHIDWWRIGRTTYYRIADMAT